MRIHDFVALGQFAVGQFAVGTGRRKKRKEKQTILTEPNQSNLT